MTLYYFFMPSRQWEPDQQPQRYLTHPPFPLRHPPSNLCRPTLHDMNPCRPDLH